MRLKKGFTLAEILIVLMVIGVIATMTIPSMMKGVTEAQLKAGYKKAYNAISNFAAMERVAGSLPASGTNDAVLGLYNALNNSLSVKHYVMKKINETGATTPDDVRNCITYTTDAGATRTLGQDDGNCGTVTLTDGSAGGLTTSTTAAAWLVTEDNMAYTVMLGGAGANRCSKKQAIAAEDNDADASDASCAIVVVDVDGLTKGSNMFEVQGLGNDHAIQEGVNLETITGDQYKIYLGEDGASAGPGYTTVTGRITADLK